MKRISTCIRRKVCVCVRGRKKNHDIHLQLPEYISDHLHPYPIDVKQRLSKSLLFVSSAYTYPRILTSPHRPIRITKLFHQPVNTIIQKGRDGKISKLTATQRRIRKLHHRLTDHIIRQTGNQRRPNEPLSPRFPSQHLGNRILLM